MKIIVFGANGDVGSRLVREALSRGHQVTAAVRNPAKADRVDADAMRVKVDVENVQELPDLIAEQDLVISALRPADGNEDQLVPLTQAMLDASRESGVRAILVGGAARLILPHDPAHTVLSAPGFLPAEVVPIAVACQKQYELVAADHASDWSYISPPAMLAPGRRTGTYRTGADRLVVDDQRRSAISMEDFAVAILDEAEDPKHRRKAFTVAY